MVLSQSLHAGMTMLPYARTHLELPMADVQVIQPAVLDMASSVIKAMGHPLRLRLLEAMEQGERTVTELQEATGAGQSIVSQQLGILRGRGIVDARRGGAHVFYRITEPKVHRILSCIRECDEAGDTPGRSI